MAPSAPRSESSKNNKMLGLSLTLFSQYVRYIRGFASLRPQSPCAGEAQTGCSNNLPPIPAALPWRISQKEGTMPTDKQFTANRLNAQRSTGPTSVAGKETASQNALRHGLTSRSVLLPEEDPAEFDALQAQLIEDLHPVGPLQRFLFARIFTAAWRLRRAHLVEQGLFQRTDDRYNYESHCSYPDLIRRRFEHAAACSDSLGKLSRYENSLFRGQLQALKQLLALHSHPPARQEENPEHKNLRNEPNSAIITVPTNTSDQQCHSVVGSSPDSPSAAPCSSVPPASVAP